MADEQWTGWFIKDTSGGGSGGNNDWNGMFIKNAIILFNWFNEYVIFVDKLEGIVFDSEQTQSIMFTFDPYKDYMVFLLDANGGINTINE